MSVPGYTNRPVQSSDIPALRDLLYKLKLALTINRLYSKTSRMKLGRDETTVLFSKVWIYPKPSSYPLWTMGPGKLLAILP